MGLSSVEPSRGASSSSSQALNQVKAIAESIKNGFREAGDALFKPKGPDQAQVDAAIKMAQTSPTTTLDISNYRFHGMKGKLLQMIDKIQDFAEKRPVLMGTAAVAGLLFMSGSEVGMLLSLFAPTPAAPLVIVGAIGMAIGISIYILSAVMLIHAMDPIVDTKKVVTALNRCLDEAFSGKEWTGEMVAIVKECRGKLNENLNPEAKGHGSIRWIGVCDALKDMAAELRAKYDTDTDYNDEATREHLHQARMALNRAVVKFNGVFDQQRSQWSSTKSSLAKEAPRDALRFLGVEAQRRVKELFKRAVDAPSGAFGNAAPRVTADHLERGVLDVLRIYSA